jgi:hypothetical protein
VFRHADDQLLFMGSMGANLVLEVLLKHNRVNLHEGVRQKRAVENVSGVFQVICFPESQCADCKFKCYLFNLLNTYLLNFTLACKLIFPKD